MLPPSVDVPAAAAAGAWPAAPAVASSSSPVLVASAPAIALLSAPALLSSSSVATPAAAAQASPLAPVASLGAPVAVGVFVLVGVVPDDLVLVGHVARVRLEGAVPAAAWALRGVHGPIALTGRARAALQLVGTREEG